MVANELISAAAEAVSEEARDVKLTPVSGGDICAAYLFDGKNRYFMKVHHCRKLLEAEAAGLQAIASVPSAPRVPEVFALVDGGDASALMLEYIHPGRKQSESLRNLGRALACMHREGRSRKFGFHQDNLIGKTPQINTWCDSWAEFFTRFRIAPLVSRAQSQGLLKGGDLQLLEKLCLRLPDLLVEPAWGSLLHGDLWGGNYLISTDGEGVLIDPAVSYGHREADVAMTELFGGFPQEFYHGYHSEFPLEDGYGQRKEIYNLYHLLNHLCMFGGGYLSSVTSIARRYA